MIFVNAGSEIIMIFIVAIITGFGEVLGQRLATYVMDSGLQKTKTTLSKLKIKAVLVYIRLFL
jgi:zinc transporter ZupT